MVAANFFSYNDFDSVMRVSGFIARVKYVVAHILSS